MAVSIIEKVLGTANPYSSNYLDVTMRLTKSIIVHHSYEAKTYNDLVVIKYRKIPDEYKKETWRYYKHLAGEYHEVDVPMKVISRDNRREIILTKETMEVHIETRESLCQFGAFYDEVVKNYPEQELLLKSIISTSERPKVSELIKFKEWQIVGYSNELVEPQETDLILRLQQRIDNFSIKNLITNYTLADNLFMASLYCQLYNFIYLSILGLRLSNVKTSRVHSYHLLNYFASHHGLDSSYAYIDDYQRMFLYRNLKYLDSHAGSNDTFKTIVEKFFDRKRVIITNYEYKQINDLRGDRTTEYGYKQKLLNNIPFVFNDVTYTPEELADKEITILPKNKKEYEYNFDDIDFRMSNSLTASTQTKDLEITLRDVSNDVKHKLIDILVDYWGVTNELGYNETIVNFLDPISGKEMMLDSVDAYKLYFVALIIGYGLDVDVIPDVEVWRAFKEDFPDDEWLFKRIQKRWPLPEKEISEISVQAPRYVTMTTRRSFRRYIERVYRFELGMWIYLGSTGELMSRYDIERGFEDLHKPYLVRNNDEKIDDFLKRIELLDLKKYTEDQCNELATIILNRASDDILEDNEINRLTQEAVVHIFSKFKSYSTQILNDFSSYESKLLGLVAPYYTISRWDHNSEYYINIPPELRCSHFKEGSSYEIREDKTILDHYGEGNFWDVPDVEDIDVEYSIVSYYNGIDDGVCISLDEELSTPDSKPTRELLIKLFNKENPEWM